MPSSAPRCNWWALGQDLNELLRSLNRGGPDSLVVPSEYPEVIVVRR